MLILSHLQFFFIISDRASPLQFGAIALLVGFSRAIALLIHSLGRSLY
ncbi:MAG: hypothetical protein LH647_15215 [Leptolyngbyaceae cyanobacterium CAN_BIN12]|nr:hypothetical protein [Leptolyngbyaceae cyanobacterium CAN_BIN12]